MDRVKTDVLVVGAGPAGTTVANLLARANVNVLLVDRCKFPRDKTCGDALTELSLKNLQVLGLLPLIEAQFHPVVGAQLYSREDINGGGRTPQTLPFYGFTAPRLLLDQLLLDHAINQGASFQPEVNIVKPLIENDRVTGAVGKTNGKEMSFEAKITICADGSGGGFARKLGLGEKRTYYALATRAYYYGVKNNTALEFYYWKEFLPFYAWIFPVRQDISNIGVVISVTNNRKNHIRQVFLDFITTMSQFTDRFESAHQISDLEAFPLQMSYTPMQSFTSGAIAIGDAAGLIHPCLGAGIGYAMESGVIASSHVLRSIQSGDASLQGLRGYGIELSRKYRASFSLARFLRKWMQDPRITLNLVKLLKYT